MTDFVISIPHVSCSSTFMPSQFQVHLILLCSKFPTV
uniref:Uncharacterized protein n=1 Tax=Arundo donax TaxID=35708 RepID=A0A0A8Z546_ARUDO